MRDYSISEDVNDILSNKLNKLVSKISNNESVECIYISSFDVLNLLNDVYIAIDIVFNDIDYFKPTTEAIITYAEIYTSVISRILKRRDYRISFNVKSSKRSEYLKDRSIYLDYLHRSTIVYDKYGLYKGIVDNGKEYEEFSNTIKFKPELKLKKI